MLSQQSPEKRKRPGRVSARTVASASAAVDAPSTDAVGSRAAIDNSPSPERSHAPKRSRITRTRRRADSVGSAVGVDRVVPPQPGTAVYARLPAVTVPVVAPVRSAMARRVSYGDLTATDVTAVAGTQYEEDVQEGDGSGVEVVYHNMDTSVTESGSEDDDRSFDKDDKNAFIDDIADKVSGESGAKDASQGDSEVGDATGGDVGNRADSPELSPVQIESTTVPVVRRASSRAKVKTEKGLYADTRFLPFDIHAWLSRSKTGHAGGLQHEDNPVSQNTRKDGRQRCAPKGGDRFAGFQNPSSSLTPDELAQYAVDVARAVVAPPAVYLEDLDGPPMPSRSSGARSRTQPKRNPSGSLAQLPVHTSLGSLPIGDGVIPVPVKTLGTSKSHTLSLAALLKPKASTASSATPPLTAQSVSDALPSATRVGAATSAAPATIPVTVVPGRRPDPAYLATLDAFLGDTFRESSPEDNGEGIDSPSPDVQAPAAAPVDLAEPDDEALRVMLPAIQEEQLRDHYATLPGLGTVRTMVPIGQDETSFDQPPYITIDDVARLYNRDTIRSLVAARHFTGAAPYCNLATLPQSAFASDGRKPLYNNCTAVAVVTGVVIESALSRTCQVGYGKNVHGLRILPFSQPWRRESTMLGLLFGETTVRSENISSAGICLASRALSSTLQHNNNRYPSPLLQKQKTTPAVKDGGSSSKSTNAKSAWPKSPSKPATLVSNTSQDRDFYHCLGFNDEIPVFDGRASRGAQFLFRDEEFAALPALPRFPRAELDRFTMVAMGYSPSVWSPSPSNPRVSLNIQFAIVLGHAPSAAALTSAGYGDY
ncbi:hypothetical protein EDD18DRAFT_1365408 [Armillaria luteobubalina]|uniref:Uncharacterized protein n=1 Tax=Armillaria luteobubalina TaxID=153913 RepID=A0AA39P4U5_9AGAR|nr:hypothetical protein EDD18DRAFT_1365408 [Armillaria luteobubalina]